MDTQEAYKELGLDPAPVTHSSSHLAALGSLPGTPTAMRRRALAGAMQLINKAYQHNPTTSRMATGNGADEAGEESTKAASSPTADAGEAAEAQAPGNTHVHKVSLTLEETILGCTRTLRATIGTPVMHVSGRGSGCWRRRAAPVMAAVPFVRWPCSAGCGIQRSVQIVAVTDACARPCDACDGSGELAVATDSGAFSCRLRRGSCVKRAGFAPW